ncbi:Hpt domain-containing protein [Gimesia maris]|jgi:HPt (histidine-containing phosphotransfer) domain-containing protein|uniref:Hpt domain-containing protein n=1 Tax=Gimesia maris TaxID=122 RepID=A0A3D3RG03_9PLAN|nr:Hpt domain-containing protein [Gimesia maris]MAC51744.1 Hpt domain-containing protein [Gimesia sp.]HAW31605.1 Hpt domain-containing protein [Planctomycetaceae bacterium]EDL58138.1 hypothetical protein PM8797T_19131 [Gimesia maris DSM 8797]QDT81186.1 hypothetical protein Mal35_46660 [Gimesia maris]QDU16919.1 hypothetical protein CA11_47570 [Gimesia maris]|tara:strand:- start:3492 stop:3875 length:384 start_codon:yes stop_codon:yes gene_type:complete
MSNTNTTQNSGQWRLIDADQVLDMVLGDTEFLDEMIDLFLSTVPEQMCEISLAIERKEAAALASTAHGFKGTVANYTKGEPYLLLQVLEDDGKSNRLQDASISYAALENEMQELISELNMLMAQLSR